MRIRKKLIFLHTCFSLALTAVLLIALRPALLDVVEAAEGAVADASIAAALSEPAKGTSLEQIRLDFPGVTLREGTSDELGMTESTRARAITASGTPVRYANTPTTTTRVAMRDENTFVLASSLNAQVRRGVLKIYILLAAALLAVYGVIAIALEVFVLPQHVYGPIRRMLSADRAVQEGNQPHELIPENVIPRDELGEIMRSRNDAIRSIRSHEQALAVALERVEVVAADLKKKNHLLENARRNLEGADRLASLGLMSAGIAHELNTPLAVAKGLVEKLERSGKGTLEPSEAALLSRVIHRLERLGDSLLDFARARSPEYRQTTLADVVDEALTLVRLDRATSEVRLVNDVDQTLTLEIDADRMVQVFVNIARNAVDAIRARGSTPGEVRVQAQPAERDGDRWVVVTVTDDGPGIEPDLLPGLFEPFVSTHLDHKGTGLGLAVAEGIVREHNGTIIARNRTERRGAVFELVLPSVASRAIGVSSRPEDQPR